MKKALIVTSVASMVDQFLIPSIQLLQELEYEVCIACNFERGSTCSKERITELKAKLDELSVKYYQIDFARDVTDISSNFSAYKQVKKLVVDNKFDLVHCHSPIGGLITRLACIKARKQGTRVLYTAHGFHFYKGAPLKNWLIYYPVEKICSYFTDTLVTINQEDYALAKKKMKSKEVVYIPGVGIDLNKFKNVTVDKALIRQELNIPEDDVLLLSVGELNKNKNHETVIRAIANTDLYYIIAGKGELQEQLQNVINELNMEDRVKLLGFCNDIDKLYQVADIFVFPSYREGLSVALMEAMASGLPVVCSKIRGNVDLIDENGGVNFNPFSIDDCNRAILDIIKTDLQELGKYNSKKVVDYSVENVIQQMLNNIY